MTNSSPVPDLGGPAASVLVVSRYRVLAKRRAGFVGDARAAIGVLGEQPGFVRASLGQATDDAELMAISTEWSDVGAYRRALSAFEVKVTAVPLLSQAIDEPTAYEVVHARTPDTAADASSGLAVDGGAIAARVTGDRT